MKKRGLAPAGPCGSDPVLDLELDLVLVLVLDKASARLTFSSPAILTGVRRERPEMPMMVGERKAREPSRSCRYVAGSEA